MKKLLLSLVTGLMIALSTSATMSGITANAAGSIYWPVPGHTRLSQGMHNGNAIDISDGSIGGADVIAACGGTVVTIYLCPDQHYPYENDCHGFGTGLVINGDDGRVYQYAHMQANSVPSEVHYGAYVSAGQKIGKVGTTGNSTGNHLHFGISYGKYWYESGIDPEKESYIYTSAHTHSYSSAVTTQPTCTATGVRTYTCSCGNSYTETIPAKGHSYVNKVVAPTTTEQGYTVHTCSVCGNSYKDTYVDPPKKNDDGWYYCDTLPTGISSDKYTIQYNNYYEKIQTTSPGSDWTNAGTVKSEWQNSGSQYKSAYDLTTSDSRILVSSIYYHFCGTNAGNEANYDQSGNFVHYDWIAADRVVSTYLGDDNGHPYYFINWPSGNQIYCATNVTCDGTYGSHSARSRAWYKENTYQDRVKVVSNKYTKNSGWVTSKDSGANSVKIRYKLKECTHSFSEWEITAPATCTQEGIKTRTCNICGATETAKVSKTQHSYTTKIVAATADAKGYTLHICSVCGDSYKDNYTDYVSTAPQIKVDSKTCAAGDSVKVQIYLENNPGIVSIRLNAEYDSDVLTLESASAGSFEDVTFGPTNKDPFTILWSDSIHGNNSTNGILAELTFKVKGNAPEGNYPVIVSYDKEEIFDENFKNVEFSMVNGSVTVSSAIPGDINGDGKVNMKDYAQFQRSLNNWDVAIEESAADINKDGKINMKDYALLQQYLNGWDVVLK